MSEAVDENTVMGQMHRHLYEQSQRGLGLDCLFCGLYLDNLFLPPLDSYEFTNVCLTKEECSDVFDYKQIEFVDKEDPKDNEFRYKADGPEQLRGVFSLDYSPCTWSSLVSFATTREAPGGINTGELGSEFTKGPILPSGDGIVADFLGIDEIPDLFPIGPLIPRTQCVLETSGGPTRRAPADPIVGDWDYAMRVIGDANWAYGNRFSIATGIVTLLDLVYKFKITEGTPEDPKQFQIVPDIKIPFTCLRAEIYPDCGLIDFKLTLVEIETTCAEYFAKNPSTGGGQDANGMDATERAQRACEAGSVIWRRDTTLGGGPTSTYYALQVVDEEGEEIPTAYDDFATAQTECGIGSGFRDSNAFASLGGKGKGKGKSSSSEAGFCQCAYSADFRYGLDDLGVFGDIDDLPFSKKSAKKPKTPKKPKMPKKPKATGRLLNEADNTKTRGSVRGQ